MDDLMEKLRQLRLNNYEAKSYLSLLNLGTGNGYSVSKHANVPSSKIYQVLNTLVEKGFAETDGMEKSGYVPVDPSLLLPRLKDEFNRNIDLVLPVLDQFMHGLKPLKTRSIDDRKGVRSALLDLLKNTKEKLLITAWPQELNSISDEMEAVARRAQVHVLAYGDFSLPGVTVYLHRRPDLVSKEYQGRRLLAVNDVGEGLAACFVAESVNAIWTSGYGITQIFADHILHDISLNYLMTAFRKNVRYEEELTKLRQKLYI